MGAETFETMAKGKTAQEAFRAARSHAKYMYGHSGYTGTIAEKGDFVLINKPPGVDARQYARELIDKADPRVDDKWGPAGCIKAGKGEWLFFGWASS